MSWRALVASVVAFVLACGAYFYRAALYPMPDLDRLTARELVQTYFERVGLNDWHNAMRCCAPEYRARNESAIRETVVLLSDLEISGGQPAPPLPGYSDYADIRLFVAEYVMVGWIHTMPINARQTRFVYVGRRNPSDPWRIVGVGSAP
jgi:hypothetical protein